RFRWPPGPAGNPARSSASPFRKWCPGRWPGRRSGSWLPAWRQQGNATSFDGTSLVPEVGRRANAAREDNGSPGPGATGNPSPTASPAPSAQPVPFPFNLLKERLQPMTERELLSSDRDAVRVLTVNRPDKLNALNTATLDALDEAFRAADADPAVRVVVLTGAGAKAFVAGADIAEMNTLSPAEGRDFSLRGQRMMRRIETLSKPVVAMVNGFALGGGLELAMSCHLRIAADTAKVGQPEVNLGLIP